MALSLSNLTTQKLFSSKFVFVILVTFFHLVASENAISQQKVSFNITQFTRGESYSDLNFIGSTAIPFSGGLLLPDLPQTDLVGRVVYKHLVPIWDSSTGNVASFETVFSYRVAVSIYAREPGDGLVFFLTDLASTAIPINSGDGLLGVANAKNAFNRFVGVEFDSYANPWDPNYEHIGINLNSLYSAKIMKWRWVYDGHGTTVKANIKYDSPSSTLTVVVTDDDGQISTLSQQLDLKWLLPEMAVIGISGSGMFQTNTIISWSFTSVLNTATRTNSNNIINITTASY